MATSTRNPPRSDIADVPFGYLISSALVAAATLLAVSPFHRPRALATISFRVGFLLNELPFVGLFWVLASTALAASEGDIDSPGGWAAFAVAVLAALGLLLVVERGLQAGPAVERGLDAALGSGWRSSIDPGLATHLRARLPLAQIIFTPLRVRRGDVERIADVPYGDAGPAHRLDVYRHRDRPQGCPVLIHLHGGRFIGGRKDREARPLLYRFASQGWVCISANYRLRPDAAFPDQLVDVKQVIGWVREHAPDHGIDPTTIFVAGSSAGGHLASLAALTPNEPTFQPGFEAADTSVSAAISLYGFYGELEPDAALPSSPNAFIGSWAPPFFVAHGDQDSYVPVDGAQEFVARLGAASSNPVVYAELPGAQHGFDVFHSLRFEAVINGIEAFAAWVRSRPTPG